MMAESREDISGLVETLVLPLVDEPDAVSIESSDTEMGSVLMKYVLLRQMPARLLAVRVVLSKQSARLLALRVLVMVSMLKSNLSMNRFRYHGFLD